MTQRQIANLTTAERDIPLGFPDHHEHFTVQGAEAVARLRQVVSEGNVLRIWIRDADGTTLIEIPGLLGVRDGVRLVPIWAAVGALASVSGTLSVEVKREAAWPM
jgi:hypothetical protein